MADEAKIQAAAERLGAIHFDALGCGTNGNNACSVCFDGVPLSAEDVAREVLRAADDVESQSSPQPEPGRLKSCTCTLVLATDSLTCYLDAGHAGPHKGKGEHEPYWWQYEVHR